jgi:hypothetical protein
MSMKQDAEMAEDRETLVELEQLFFDFSDYLLPDDEQVERLRQIHARLKAQFAERYGERP